MVYQAPRITDFGSVELRVHTQNFGSPNDHVEDGEGPPPEATSTDGGGSAGLGLIGVAGTLIAVMAGRRNEQQEAGAGAIEEEEEESHFE